MKIHFLSPSWWFSSCSISKLLPLFLVLPRQLHSFRSVYSTRVISSFKTSSSRFHTTKMSANQYQKPIEIGLTGSIGMGKSTITKQIRRLGFPVFDADDAVHQLYSRNGEAVAPLQALFPNAIVNNAVDRKELMQYIMEDGSVVKEIEKIVHPLVVAKREQFLHQATTRGELLVVYDIPLLFESNYRFDYTIVVTADAETQQARVLSRPGMTLDKFHSILSKQLTDAYKREHADYLIHTHYESFAEGRAQLAGALEDILLHRQPHSLQAWGQCASSTVMPAVPSRLAQVVKAVVFDLDDTLVPVSGPLAAAASRLHALSLSLLPKTVAKHGHGLAHAVREMMHRTVAENPLVKHDLTEMRIRSLQRLAAEHGEEAHVPACVEEFLKVRSQVSEFLYSDTVPCLEALRHQGLQLGILTNGNAYLQDDTQFARHFSLFLTASDIGASKPSPLGFLACCQHLKLSPHEVLYVGDSYENDVRGAKAVGMKTAYLVRPEEQTNGSSVPQPDAFADIVITSLDAVQLEQQCLARFGAN